MPFYATRGAAEILVVHDDRRFELHRLTEDRYEQVEDGTSSVPKVTFNTVDGQGAADHLGRRLGRRLI